MSERPEPTRKQIGLLHLFVLANCRKFMRTKKRVTGHVLVITYEGERMTDMVYLDIATFDKDAAAAVVFSALRQEKADAVVMVNEAWSRVFQGDKEMARGREEARRGRSLADDPEAKEIVLITIYTKNSQYLASHPIVRSGKNVALCPGELVSTRDPTVRETGGRFINDDVNRVH